MQTVEVLTALAMVFRSLLSFEGIEIESHVEKLTGQKKIKIKILARVWYIDFNWFHFGIHQLLKRNVKIFFCERSVTKLLAQTHLLEARIQT